MARLSRSETAHPDMGRPKTAPRRSPKNLAIMRGPWQGAMMSRAKKNPSGGGAIIALLILAGTISGGLLGQPSIRLLCGTAAGVLIALLMWLVDRRK